MEKIKEAKSSLKKARWARKVSDEALDGMLEHATFRSDSRKSHIFRLGDPSSRFYGLLSGQVRLTIPAETGDEFIIMDVTKGRWFGGTSLTENAPRTADALALVDTEIVEIPASVVRETAEKFPRIYKNLFAEQSLYVRLLCNLMASMLFFPLKARLANRLLMLIVLDGRREGRAAYLETTLSQSDFAKLVSGSRQQVNRVFRQWNDEGIVNFADGQYHIPSVKRLFVESKSTAP
ncbi:Crp/Fnr family transcriptional regulator [Candidatus Marimicrobium litorale]|uniref:Crp/Fnr family transcriptional regulator n=1 Tax=Candidatus Marimicrobium litorale TaxID=2518991 RepID=A0ABT3T5R2_9GAMM|nr:Crp/Fnr family transcriptional regulator [Candidatus Marimicrobium litorale]MCX2977146.1 Crp/Fnr family transcriptional regulator [Candidatus Marimicrobium litorale]